MDTLQEIKVVADIIDGYQKSVEVLERVREKIIKSKLYSNTTYQIPVRDRIELRAICNRFATDRDVYEKVKNTEDWGILLSIMFLVDDLSQQENIFDKLKADTVCSAIVAIKYAVNYWKDEICRLVKKL